MYRTALLMWLLIIPAGFFLALPAYAQLDTDLLKQAENWKKGEIPPPRLLKFPDGKIDQFPECDLRVFGSEVIDYISNIQNVELLSALLLDYRAQPETLRAAASRLVALKGTTYVARILKGSGREVRRSELAVLAQLLRSPYVAIQVARIGFEKMKPSTAKQAMQEMSAALEAGARWEKAYGAVADAHPNLKDREENPGSVSTLVTYLYDGVVSPNGFDILRYYVAADLQPQHLQEVFRKKHGTLILLDATSVYLYHVKQYYDESE